MKVGIVVPHIFMQRELLGRVIFSPGVQVLRLANSLQEQGVSVTLFSPGEVDTNAPNITADLRYFKEELAARGDDYLGLLRKHPLTFITLARQVQSELIAQAYTMANNDQLDIVHIYTNEEDTALPFAGLCNKPTIFTHHDPFNFLVHYKNVFPKYPHLNWLSLSYAQRKSMPAGTNWVGNIYHGIDPVTYQPNFGGTQDYAAYLGRIIEPKGVHLAVRAVKQYNKNASKPLKLKIAGKHYSSKPKNSYWEKLIVPELNDPMIEYVGHIKDERDKQEFLANAAALLVPSIFEEPFGMVLIEALACGTPLIGLDSGAIPEIIEDKKTGFIVEKKGIVSDGKRQVIDETSAVQGIAEALGNASKISRKSCRESFEQRFTLKRMVSEHIKVYEKLTK